MKPKFFLLFAMITCCILLISDGINGQPADSNEDFPDWCTLKPDLGTCRAKVKRFYYNVRHKQCEVFYFGGCGGNANNFKTIEDCNDTCT